MATVTATTPMTVLKVSTGDLTTDAFDLLLLRF